MEPRPWFALALLPFGLLLGAEGTSTTPSYSHAGIVSAASYEPGLLAPNGLVTIFGTNLSWGDPRGLVESDIRDGRLPTVLSGVRVYVSGQPAPLYYVSEDQINFLMPEDLLAGEHDLWVFRQSVVGATVRVKLLDAAPALFPLGDGFAIATHADNALITAAAPAAPGEIIVLYAAGLGRTDPRVRSGQLADVAAWIKLRNDLRVLVNGEPIDPARIYYAGVTPGSAGLYQINFKLPDTVQGTTDIQIQVGEQSSAVLGLPVQAKGGN